MAARNCKGMTLVELTVVLALAVIMLAMAVPGYDSVTKNAQLTGASNLLTTHMAYTRTEALSRATPVTICASLDGIICADANRWELGWIIFTDEGAKGEIDGDDQLLKVEGRQPPGVSIVGAVEAVRYLPDGSIEI